MAGNTPLWESAESRYSTAETAEILTAETGRPITDAQIRWWITELQLPVMKAGSRWRLRQSDVQALIRVAHMVRSGIPLAEVRQQLGETGGFYEHETAATAVPLQEAGHHEAQVFEALRSLTQRLEAIHDTVIKGLCEVQALGAEQQRMGGQVTQLEAAISQLQQALAKKDTATTWEQGTVEPRFSFPPRQRRRRRRIGFWSRLLGLY